jgi:phenylacetate-CoA ligase
MEIELRSLSSNSMTDHLGQLSTRIRPQHAPNSFAVNIWGKFLRYMALPAGDWVFGQDMMKRLRFLERAQWWDRERVLEQRDMALREVIRIAYCEVQLYRELFDASGLSPGDIRTARDLEKLPIVTKDMIRAKFPHGATRATGRKTHTVSTSGSTGKNFQVLEDLPTMSFWRASNLLAMQWAGWTIGESHLQTGMTLNRSFDRKLKDSLLRCHYFSAYDLSDSQLEIILCAMEKYKLAHLWGYPGSLYFLARKALQLGWNTPLRSIATWGDTLPPHFRATIEKAFGKSVSDTYGCSEGIQIAAQCSHGSYHLHSLDVIADVTDDDGRPVKDGVAGNLILTRLHAGPMPLIRYRVGDVGIAGKSKVCPCGRGFEILDAIHGREADAVLTPCGNRLIVHFFTGILEHFSEVALFQVIQDDIAFFTLKIVPHTSYSPQTEKRILATMREKGGQDIQIKFEVEKDIPITASGKRRFVVSTLSSADMFSSPLSTGRSPDA